jgi:integrase
LFASDTLKVHFLHFHEAENMAPRPSNSGLVLTEKTAAAAKPRKDEDGKPRGYDIHDRGRSGVKGLMLVVSRGGTKSFAVQIARGKRVTLSPSYPTMTIEQARAEALKLLGRSSGGADVVAERRQDRTTLRDYLDGAWWNDYAKDNVETATGLRKQLKYSFAALLDKPMADISVDDIAQWRRTRNARTKADGVPRKPVTFNSMKRDLDGLRTVLRRAVKSGTIAAHQIDGYELTQTLDDKHNPENIRYLTKPEARRLRAALVAREKRLRAELLDANARRAASGQEPLPVPAPDQYADYLAPLVLLALTTGLRRGDLFGLKWEHVRLDATQPQIRKIISKTSHARRKRGLPVTPATIPLSTEAQEILARVKKYRPTDTEYVFPSPKTKGRLNNVDRSWDSLITAAKIDDFTFHDLRHTFASWLVMAGVDLYTVRDLLTHSDIRMTQIYAHLAPSHKAAAVERVFGKGAAQ